MPVEDEPVEDEPVEEDRLAEELDRLAELFERRRWLRQMQIQVEEDLQEFAPRNAQDNNALNRIELFLEILKVVFYYFVFFLLSCLSILASCIVIYLFHKSNVQGK